MSGPSDRISFNGQVAVVTGAGRGLGRVWAHALAARGATVIALGRGSQSGKNEAELVSEIKALGGKARAVTADVSDRKAVFAAVGQVLADFGKIDILINNAGITRDRSFAKVDLDDFCSVIDTNLMGAVNCTTAVWPGMIARCYGRVVMITSSAGLAGNFGQAAYGTSKMALVGLANTLGIEGEKKNVYVNCFSPIGATEMNADVLPPEILAHFEASKLAPGVVFLASDRAPNRTILMGGGGSFECAELRFTCGGTAESAEELAHRFEAVADWQGAVHPASAQTQMEIELANTRRTKV